MAKNELVDLIKSFPDADSRAHFLLENCLAFTNDPDLQESTEAAAMGDGPHSRLLAALLPRTEKKVRPTSNRRRRPNRPVNPFWTKGGK